jgi:heavy metal sensor kinase
MTWHSFRARLALWNIAVLALVLAAFGLAAGYTVQRQIGALVDRDLAQRALVSARLAARGSRLPAAPGPPAASSSTGEPRAPNPEPRAAPTGDSDADRIAAFRRPRYVDRDGRIVRPTGAKELWDPSTLPDALAGRARYSTVTVAGERVRVFAAPLLRDGEIVGAVQVARELEDYERLWSSQMRTLLALILPALLAAAAGGLFLTGRALRPVRQVTQAAARIGAEDLHARLKVTGRDELAALAATFNAMIARLEAAFEQQRRFTADASHELRTPLSRIKVSTSMALAEEPSLAEYRTALEVADQAADAMARLIDELLTLARADAGELRPRSERLDLRDVLRDAAAAVPPPPAVALLLDLPPDALPVTGDADHLRRVFVNLLENARRHTTAGQITLAARADGDAILATVTDTGEGIAPEHLPHLFERFYRVDTARARRHGGSGLGLAICRGLLAAHHGTITLTSAPGEGTTVQVRLPRAAGASHKSAAKQGALETAEKAEKALKRHRSGPENAK